MSSYSKVTLPSRKIARRHLVCCTAANCISPEHPPHAERICLQLFVI
jgi:hypothetical protein